MNLPDPSASLVAGYDRRELARYLAGDLPSDERQEMDDAVGRSPELRAFVDAHRRDRFPISKAETLAYAKGHRSWSLWQIAAPASGLIAAAAAVFLFSFSSIPTDVAFRGATDVRILRLGPGPAEVLGALSGLRSGDRFSVQLVSERAGVLALRGGLDVASARELWRSEFAPREERMTGVLTLESKWRYWIVTDPDRSPPPDEWQPLR